MTGVRNQEELATEMEVEDRSNETKADRQEITSTPPCLNDEEVYLTTEAEILDWMDKLAIKSENLLRDLKSFSQLKIHSSDVEETTERKPNSRSIDEHVQVMSQVLLECCDPGLCPTEYDALVAYEQNRIESLVMVDPERKILQFDRDKAKRGIELPESQLYLKFQTLLCELSPISFHLAVRILDQVLQDDVNALIRGIILFGKWLPEIAPHLHPIFEDFVCNVSESQWHALANRYYAELKSDDDELMIDASTGNECLFRESQLLSESIYNIFHYFSYKRGELQRIQSMCTWNFAHALLAYHRKKQKLLWQENEHLRTEIISHKPEWNEPKTNIYDGFRYCYTWYSARAVALILDIRPPQYVTFLQKSDQVHEYCNNSTHIKPSPFSGTSTLSHPRWFNKLRIQARNAYPQYSEILTNTSISRVPDPEILHSMIWLHPSLARPVPQILQYIHGSRKAKDTRSLESARELIRTKTTLSNLTRLSMAMCLDPPPPLLVCGPRGSGKTALIRELAKTCCASSTKVGVSDVNHHLLELHLDEDTDSKTLLGSMVATEEPGKFEWRPGPLTLAVQHGRWVLMEDVDKAPSEILAALKPLLETRVLPYAAIRQRIKAHANFRFFGTCTTSSKNRLDDSQFNYYHRRVPGPNRHLITGLWRQVFVDHLPIEELGEIAQKKFPTLPQAIIESCLQSYSSFDLSHSVEIHTQIKDEDLKEKDEASHDKQQITNALLRCSSRAPSIRDFIKICCRIFSNITFEPGTLYATESQRMLCLAEVVDVFVSYIPMLELRREFVARIAAPIWKVTPRLAVHYMELRKPAWTLINDKIELGRATMPIINKHPNNSSQEISRPGNSSQFSDTGHALRLMESIGVCIAQNEPLLLVGETGCGKTTLVQRLAYASGRDLVVQNLSLQTDSTDLLGGFRPVEVKQIARQIYERFVELFVTTFSRKQNAEFLDYITTSFEKRQWKRLSQCFRRASKMGLDRFQNSQNDERADAWHDFSIAAERFERQRMAVDSSLAFAFTEGALVDAIKTGKWVLLDEVNLASSETLQRLSGLLDDASSSLTLTERGDSEALGRNQNFRLFAAMNPATDAGKKELPSSLRARFTELYVDELTDPVELRSVAAKYLAGAISSVGSSLESSDTVLKSVETYLKCKSLADQVLVDGGRQKPRYTLRSFTRALSAAKRLILEQGISVQRGILEGFELAFEGPLDEPSRKILQKSLGITLGINLSKKDLNHPGRRPGGKGSADDYVLVEPFWIKLGPETPVDWKEGISQGVAKFVLTPSASNHLRRLSRAVSAGNYPVLLEGPTSAGKTTLVQYLAAKCGFRCVRINNHEHTDIQEYTGSYVASPEGRLKFQDGLLVQCLRRGDWIILDELNLAPSEVLEALNRLLDDNRELYLAETNEVVIPHPNFRLFATQNPCGAYGGRKPLSRAFRNRFVEVHMDDIPSDEMVLILEKRCGCPPSHAKLLVKVMITLRQRRSKSGVFRGKDGLITPRDLLRWAERRASSKVELAIEGFMLLGERLRDEDEKQIVKQAIEETIGVSIDIHALYYGHDSENRQVYNELSKLASSEIAPTKPLLRMLQIVRKCVAQKEPVLLCGETGTGKTTLVQLMSLLLCRELHIVNCHATMETSDVIGGLRPTRGRPGIYQELFSKVKEFLATWPYTVDSVPIPEVLSDNGDVGDGSDATEALFSFAKKLWESSLVSENVDESPYTMQMDHAELRSSKRRKLQGEQTDGKIQDSASLWCDIQTLYTRYNSIFEWADGPLVTAMKLGHIFMLDEINLADDAVLERLNSVLEPSRQLTLAEKGGNDLNDPTHGDSVVQAHQNFLFFATMNPGNDFGKRELSPALRSRFTEIWVPQMTDREDLDHVIYRQLNPIGGEGNLDRVRVPMLNYIEWFKELCSRPSSPFSDLSLSVRDVQTWARFVYVVCTKNPSLNIWEAFAHGAELMHLDGICLGTGLSYNDASNLHEAAIDFIRKHSPNEGQTCCLGLSTKMTSSCNFSCSQGCFGKEPFFIPLGPMNRPELFTFSMKAPTTALNLQRVLRALQLPRPILLEGSPGVGKTSLISALASASGYRLVRFNLSEQTDISDLMGSDLPDPSGDGRRGAAFKWCDGAFLSALKRGDWVLLDELNLASQSVLEGLNSCLDHRSQVFIPELGKTFECPSSFRVFAAQNPVTQGGGRKGLPKSFLNRFTKVFVESLLPSDLNTIVCARFPHIPKELIAKMVQFTWAVHNDVVVLRRYGHVGSPWEFNLRDVVRWCELMTSEGRTLCPSDAVRYVGIIFQQRMRSIEDRRALAQQSLETFGHNPKLKYKHAFEIQPEIVCIGNVTLKRLNHINISTADLPFQGHDLSFPRLQLPEMEAVARCINMRWPCLLVGPASSGKSHLLRTLADSANANLEEISLTPSTDVTELIGCFEQRDFSSLERELLQVLGVLVNTCTQLADLSPSLILEAQSKLQCLREHQKQGKSGLHKFRGSKNDTQFIIDTCCAIGLNLPENDKFTMDLRSAKELFNSVYGRARNEIEVNLFRWIDGILVTSMEKGHWLHLENVNLCPASVLDRLNPLLEDEGKLTLTECLVPGVDGVGTGQRDVNAHPNFRIFLSMNAEMGEVSRAMRNRCVEICLIPKSPGSDSSEIPDESSPKVVYDMFQTMKFNDSDSSRLLKEQIDLHLHDCASAIIAGEEVRTMNDLISLNGIVKHLLMKGLSLCSSLRLAWPVVYGTTRVNKLALRRVETLCLIEHDLGVRKWACSPQNGNQIANSIFFGLLLNDEIAKYIRFVSVPKDNGNLMSQAIQSLESFCGDIRYASFDSMDVGLVSNTVATLPNANCFQGGGFTDGDAFSFSNPLRFMLAFRQYTERLAATRSNDLSKFILGFNVVEDTSCVVVKGKTLQDLDSIYWHRFPELFLEFCTYRDLQLNWHERSYSCSSIMEVSFGIHHGLIDQSAISCPITPLMFPLFSKIDLLLNELAFGNFFAKELYRFLSHRDQLWKFLHRTRYDNYHNSNILHADGSGFYIHYRWITKSFKRLFLASKENSTEANNYFAAVEDCFNAILDALSQLTGGIISFTNEFWKKNGHPCIPSTIEAWQTRELLLEVAQSTCVSPGYKYSVSEYSHVSLDRLLALNHPCLFAIDEHKKDLLNALCMLQWASTDESSKIDDSRTVVLNELVSAPKFFRKKFLEAEESFKSSIRGAALDLTIKSVENVISVEELIRISAKSFVQGKKEKPINCDFVLKKFASLQTSQFEHFWCVLEEEAIIQDLSSIFLANRKPEEGVLKSKNCAKRIKSFIARSLMNPFWTADHLRPFQTFVWSCENPQVSYEELEHLLKCIFPTMFSLHEGHIWSKSFGSLDFVSPDLEMPSLVTITTNQYTDDLNDSTRQSTCLGPVRLQNAMAESLLFRLNGYGKLRLMRRIENVPHLTIENCHVRIIQMKEMVNHLVTLNFERFLNEALVIRKLFVDVLDSLRDHFDDQKALHKLISFVSQDDPRSFSQIASLFEDLMNSCSFEALKPLAIGVVIPLISHIVSASKERGFDENQGEAAISWVLIGLLRLHLSLPASPIDPALIPEAKAQQLKERAKILYPEMILRRAGDLLNQNLVQASRPSSILIVEESARLKDKYMKQRSKQVARPESSPSYSNFFAEVHRFAMSTGSIEEVSELANGLLKPEHSELLPKLIAREANWQSTAHAFIERLSTHFLVFEDVGVPVTNAIRCIQRGLQKLAKFSQKKRENNKMYLILDDLYNRFLHFPFTSTREDFVLSVFSDNRLAGYLKSQMVLHHGFSEGQAIAFAKEFRLQSLFAFLYLTEVKIRMDGKLQGSSHIAELNWLFEQLVDFSVQEKTVDIKSKKMLLDVEEEQRFRTQFPDHAKEFNMIVQAAEIGVHDDELLDKLDEGTQNVKSPEFSLDLNDEQISLLCDTHKRLLSSNVEDVDDYCRVRCFIQCYVSASQIAIPLETEERPSGFMNEKSGHLMSLILSLNLCKGSKMPLKFTSLKNQILSSSQLDFYNDPNPSKTAEACTILHDLTMRLAQLLTAFPGNAILVAVRQVTDRVSKLDLEESSLGKVVAGMEVILKKAQEWEEHASQHVKIGPSLKAVSSLVSKWRQLELSSWPALLSVREKTFSNSAKRHWLTLYRLVHNGFSQKQGGGSCHHYLNVNLPLNTAHPPAWIAKSMLSKKSILQIHLHKDVWEDEVIRQLVKTVDTLILSSGIGEFETRLELLLSFSRDLLLNYDSCHRNMQNPKLHLSGLAFSRLLHSMWCYYTHFRKSILAKIAMVKQPIEKKLKDEAKLAKWDDQSYYSLAESAEKNHRKLFKHLREYDAELETTVFSVLEEQLSRGVRKQSEENDGPSTKIPTKTMLFPDLEHTENHSKNGDTIGFSSLTCIEEWNEVESLIINDKYLLRAKQYAAKMNLFLNEIETIKSSAIACNANLEELTLTIFERIEFLRGEKITTPMKHRALTDLFKKLKGEGFSSLKWSVPIEIREMNNILLLAAPTPEEYTFSHDPNLERGEKYFNQTCAEISRLRSEISLLGSQYMSQRELKTMLGYCDSVFFMVCQQRSLIGYLINNIDGIDKILIKLADVRRLPMAQKTLGHQVFDFELKLFKAKESVDQLLLFLRLASDVNEEPSKNTFLRDVICQLTPQVLSLAKLKQQFVRETIDPNRLISLDQLNKIQQANGILQKVSTGVRCISISCSEIKSLPLDIFRETLISLELATAASRVSLHSEFETKKDNEDRNFEEGLAILSRIVQSSMLVVQKLMDIKVPKLPDQPDKSIMVLHQDSLSEWNSIDTGHLWHLLMELQEHLSSVCGSTDGPSIQLNAFLNLCQNINIMIQRLQQVCQKRLREQQILYANAAKFNYVLSRIFRVLVAKGFCSDKTKESENDAGQDGAPTTFEDDVEGTGMGDGEGKQDVTDQIENEEQLLGLQGDDKSDKKQDEKDKQLDREEAETGMEMENDFDGEMFDMPEKQEDNNDDKQNDEEEELDREMGDDSSPNDDVVDEKLWDGEDEDDDQNSNDEKMEEDSKIKGDTIEDEMHTKNDDKNDKGEDSQKDEMQSDEQGQNKPENTNETEDKVSYQ